MEMSGITSRGIRTLTVCLMNVVYKDSKQIRPPSNLKLTLPFLVILEFYLLKIQCHCLKSAVKSFFVNIELIVLDQPAVIGLMAGANHHLSILTRIWLPS